MEASNPFARHWALAPDITFLNHGSFGACPRPVLETQNELRLRMERNPVGFLVREFEPLLDQARLRLARFVGGDPEGLAFLANVTTAVNTVLANLRLGPGDEILTTNHEYNACRTALEAAAERCGARIVVVPIPFPLASPDEIRDAVLARIGPRTRFALLDHVTSPTALVLPVERLVADLEGRGITTLVDGAHAPGMLALDLKRLGASYYAGNCHKWICAPKGAGFVYARSDRRPGMRPLVIGHGANATRPDRSRFRLEFDWLGTQDGTACLCVPAALDFMGALLPGGWAELRARNHALACEGRRILCAALRAEPPCPEDMLGSMAAVVLADGENAAAARTPDLPPERAVPPDDDPLEARLFDRHGIVVPVFRWQSPRVRILRISAQIYNEASEYRRLGAIVAENLVTPLPGE